jgi:hypothetical protein
MSAALRLSHPKTPHVSDKIMLKMGSNAPAVAPTYTRTARRRAELLAGAFGRS